MPPKASKKRPRSETNTAEAAHSRTIFLSPSLKPDVRLKVFVEEFHVHSIILKLHSNYFRRFLDSPDKPAGPASASFHYEYTSVVDEDGEWALEPANKGVPSEATPDLETEAFRKLLCAMYNRPYTIINTSELKVITRLADYYCALPIVSATLSGALTGSPMFQTVYAMKLRHSVLFRECFMRLAARWGQFFSEDQAKCPVQFILDPVLRRLIDGAYTEICQNLLVVNQELLRACMTSYSMSSNLRQFKKFDQTTVGPGSNAWLYRELQTYLANERREFETWNVSERNSRHDAWDSEDLEDALELLLKNNLFLEQSECKPGEGIYKTSFLCADIPDEKMPWDVSETDCFLSPGYEIETMPPKAASRKRPRAEPVAEEPPPIIFHTPGLKPDVRLNVFGQDMHVHSIVLKLHSNYFRRFLDSPDKSGAPASPLFQYEYVTVVDGDEEWALESATKAVIIPEMLVQAAKQPRGRQQTRAFWRLLCAMYHRPYTINEYYDLLHLTQLADFYCALPIVSSTLSGALLGGSLFKTSTLNLGARGGHDPDDSGEEKPNVHKLSEFPNAAEYLLPCARKLRHIALFRECFIHVVANWTQMQYDFKQGCPHNPSELALDPVLGPLIKDSYIELCRDIIRADQALHFATALCGGHWIPQIPVGTIEWGEPDQNASYYRFLYRHIQQSNQLHPNPPLPMKRLEKNLACLLTSKLILDQNASGAGEGVYKSQFLCVEILDHNMPWDADETDW
ncbi:hypothetical protein LSUE1_G001897 [Lachnellula suecica]|uniref:BTB domain-containing protein n=1 Tax=Lachnellula suecica TaxID=602035 RepID=A0A8T9CIA6_9HELO|nr:hypothetical protein LSUE1_G001897 [Lachnellula suecica]